MKKTILTLCVLLAFALIFTGCGGNDAGGNPAGNGGTPDGGNPAGGSDSLDGDWVGGWKVADCVSLNDFNGNQALYDAFLASPLASRTIPVVKFTISGNSYTALPATDEYSDAAYSAAMTDSPEPEPEWDTRPENSDSGTVTVSGNTITFTSSIQGGGTGTLASDKKSFTLTYSGGEPMTFVKQ